MSDTGLDLLLGISWQQEVIHQLVFRELLRETTLGRALSLWSDEVAPRVLYEPFRGLSTIERPVGGDPLADDSPRHVRVTPVGERWAGLEPAFDAG